MHVGVVFSVLAHLASPAHAPQESETTAWDIRLTIEEESCGGQLKYEILVSPPAVPSDSVVVRLWHQTYNGELPSHPPDYEHIVAAGTVNSMTLLSKADVSRSISHYDYVTMSGYAEIDTGSEEPRSSWPHDGTYFLAYACPVPVDHQVAEDDRGDNADDDLGEDGEFTLPLDTDFEPGGVGDAALQANGEGVPSGGCITAPRTQRMHNKDLISELLLFICMMAKLIRGKTGGAPSDGGRPERQFYP